MKLTLLVGLTLFVFHSNAAHICKAKCVETRLGLDSNSYVKNSFEIKVDAFSRLQDECKTKAGILAKTVTTKPSMFKLGQPSAFSNVIDQFVPASSENSCQGPVCQAKCIVTGLNASGDLVMKSSIDIHRNEIDILYKECQHKNGILLHDFSADDYRQLTWADPVTEKKLCNAENELPALKGSDFGIEK